MAIPITLPILYQKKLEEIKQVTGLSKNQLMRMALSFWLESDEVKKINTPKLRIELKKVMEQEQKIENEKQNQLKELKETIEKLEKQYKENKEENKKLEKELLKGKQSTSI